ncbi:MAG: alpha/beta hydrolase [Planctomycetes bacterium]|nr:alpha/beta hydrolase [Planctomycetota bacterium]
MVRIAAQDPALALWPDGAPGQLGTAEKDIPRLTLYRAPGESPRPAFVVCPGGGYHALAMAHEGRDIAAWLNGIGITAAVLDYRHRAKGYGHPWPLRDVQRAMRLVRHRAAEWQVDPAKVGVIGFSAGGHLAASVSVHHDGGDADAADPIDRESCRPDFAVLCYPVIAFGQDYTHKGSQKNLLGDDAAPELVAEMSAERQVADDTPPTFLWHTTADTVVPPENSVVYYLALVRHHVPCELHVFETGRHGLGLAPEMPCAAWSQLCQRWLEVRGVLP